MEIIEAKVGTYARKFDLPIHDGEVKPDFNQDIIKVAVVERHKATGSIGKGFVKGFHLKEGAIASTVAHDSHNLLIIGTNEEDMALAGNTLAEVGGGMVAVKDGNIPSPLLTAGLMSEEPVEKLAPIVAKMDEAWKILDLIWFPFYDHIFLAAT